MKLSELQADAVFQRSNALDVFVKETHTKFLPSTPPSAIANADPVISQARVMNPTLPGGGLSTSTYVAK